MSLRQETLGLPGYRQFQPALDRKQDAPPENRRFWRTGSAWSVFSTKSLLAKAKTPPWICRPADEKS
ncbi:hypothetical protein NK553_17970 [Pseudomonas sp. ZM23]|uniref:Uncharacterized protein n=2 Tax=Pseudomonas triclosanedens TaxID=2961893 RepID=A0ABY6ZRW6_9PSED|nr:hypothetical protein [Pseudomonas triclosanedens]MCP8465841.1 hypothetical protein [Pseudomonas triclosanedens]MCP8472162.1 hypothetical protein [Pseudomonas triclosanedens]MCP8477140.1 hypothetical protein [Pseudomonas triclosanedens]WAI47521.1 hypothetical protein OU419_17245 [Pseudomonas triclosanedens]